MKSHDFFPILIIIEITNDFIKSYLKGSPLPYSDEQTEDQKVRSLSPGPADSVRSPCSLLPRTFWFSQDLLPLFTHFVLSYFLILEEYVASILFTILFLISRVGLAPSKSPVTVC